VTGIAAAEERLSGLRPVGRSGTGPTVDENSGTAGALSGREFLSPQAAALAAQGVPIFLTWRLFGSLPGYARVGRSETCLTGDFRPVSLVPEGRQLVPHLRQLAGRGLGDLPHYFIAYELVLHLKQLARR